MFTRVIYAILVLASCLAFGAVQARFDDAPMGAGGFSSPPKPGGPDAAHLTFTGPSSGGMGVASSNFTVTRSSGTFNGTQTVTIADGSAGGTITPSVGSPGTGSVIVTPTSGTSSFTFTYNAASPAATKTLMFTNSAGLTESPSSLAYVASNAGPTGSCSQSTAFFARTSGLSSTEISAYDTMICGLVTDGIVTGTLTGVAGCGTHLDALYILSTNTPATAALNICGTGLGLTVNGAPQFTPDQGYTGTGHVADYLATGFVPSTASSPNWQLNSAHFGIYIQTNRTTPCDCVDIGTNDFTGTAYSDFVPNYRTNGMWAEVNRNDFPIVASPPSTQAMWVASRTALKSCQPLS